MKLSERLSLLKAGYTKTEIEAMAEEGIKPKSENDRLDTIENALVILTEAYHKNNLLNTGGKEEKPTETAHDILKALIENKPDESEDK